MAYLWPLLTWRIACNTVASWAWHVDASIVALPFTACAHNGRQNVTQVTNSWCRGWFVSAYCITVHLCRRTNISWQQELLHIQQHRLEQKCSRTRLQGSSSCRPHCAVLLGMFDGMLVTLSAHRRDIGIIFCEVQGIPSILRQIFILPGSC